MAKYIDCSVAVARLTALEVTEPNATMSDAKRVLADMPAADVVPVVHGRWIIKKTPFTQSGKKGECSICNKHIEWLGNPLKYCPNCGAKMDGVE